MSERICAAVVLAAFLLMEGCYHSRLTVSGEPATDYQKKTTHALFWGLVQDNVVTSNCRGDGLQEVRMSTNFGYLLLSVATLGIWVPMEVEWRCAKAAPPDTSAFGLN